MNRYLYVGAFCSTLAVATPALSAAGGSCHFHGSKPATENVVLDCANQRRDALVAGGKLDKSWQSVKAEKAELIDGKKGKEWRVIFRDAAAKDKSKETLYVMFTVPGNFIAANFTGQ